MAVDEGGFVAGQNRRGVRDILLQAGAGDRLRRFVDLAHDGRGRRPAITIFASSATNSSAVCNPIPLVAPVTTATLPSSRPITSPPVAIGSANIPAPRPARQARLFHCDRQH